MRLAALLLLLSGCEGGCRGRVEIEQRPAAPPDLPLVSRAMGCPTGSCDGRAVPAPGGAP